VNGNNVFDYYGWVITGCNYANTAAQLSSGNTWFDAPQNTIPLGAFAIPNDATQVLFGDGSWGQIPAVNPFDQSLNTTDSVTFAAVAGDGSRLTGVLPAWFDGSGVGSQFSNAAFSIDVTGSDNYSITIGSNAQGYLDGIAVGPNAQASYGSIAVGSGAFSDLDAVAIGTNAHVNNQGTIDDLNCGNVAIGGDRNGTHPATIGDNLSDTVILGRATVTSQGLWYGVNGTAYCVMDGSGHIDASKLDFSAVPTSDPHVAGQCWNNAGTLKVSTGP